MKNRKIYIQISLLAVAFLLLTYFTFNYLVFGRMELSGIIGNDVFFEDNSNSEELEYSRNYVVENQTVNESDPNGVGTITYDYLLTLNNLPEKIKSLSITLLEPSNNNNDIMVTFYSENGDCVYYNNKQALVFDENQFIWMIGEKNVDKITISTSVDIYGGSDISNPDIISINQITFNKSSDIVDIKSVLIEKAVQSLIISALVFAILFVILKLNIDNKIFRRQIPIEKTFLAVSISVGAVFLLLFPVFQIPDELTHINLIYEELNWDIRLQDTAGDFSNTMRLILNSNEKVDISDYLNMDARLALPSGFVLPSYRIIRHLPQALGILFGSLLHIPAIFTVTICEIFALVFYAFVCYFALKLMPFKKELMFFIMLLPICLQQMGSFSYDAILIPICFLFIAYSLYIKFVKSEFTLLDVAYLLIMLLVIAIVKIPYIMLAGLLILIPLKKYNFNFGFFRITGGLIKKRWYIFVAISLILLIPVVYLALNILKNSEYGRICLAALKTPSATYELLLNTIKRDYKQYLIGITGNFGWLDVTVSHVFTVFVLINLLVFSFFDFNKIAPLEEDKRLFNLFEKIYIIILAVLMCAITILSMFAWTLQAYNVQNINQLSIAELSEYIHLIPFIGGLQGRYFVPIIPLFLLPVCSKKVTTALSKINYKTYITLYYCIAFSYVLVILLQRYWI